MSVQQLLNTNQPTREPHLPTGALSRYAIWIAGAVVAALLLWFGIRYLPSLPTNTAATLPDTAAVSTTQPTTTLPAEPAAPADAEVAAATADTATPATVENSYSRSIVAIARNEETVLWTVGGDAAFTVLPAGTRLTAIGQSADGLWLYTQTDGSAGWVAVDQVFAFDYDGLPIVTLDTVAQAAATAVNTVADAVAPDAAASAAARATAAPGALPTGDTTTAEPPGATTSGAPATVTLTDARLNVRSGPGTGYAVIAQADPGASLVTVGRDTTGEWIAIALADADGGFGWVSAAYISMDEPVTNLPVSTAVNSAAVAATATAAPAVGATDAAAASATGLDGTLVFQSSGGGMIYAYDLATAALWSLTTGFDPAISPDGQTVAFVRDGGENGIYLINSDGSNERLLYSGSELLSSPKWSTDGAWILFSRSDDNEVLLAGPMRSDDEGDGISHDYNYVLSVVDYNGQQFHDVASLLSARAPDWNAAGIVYQSEAGLQLTSDTPNAANTLLLGDYLKPYFDDPDWQPNGGQIVYQGKEASHWELFSVAADGTGVTALTRPATTLVDEIPSNVAPAWSPDGQHIVFLSNRQTDGTTGDWRLWVMDTDGSNQRALSIAVDINYTFGVEQVVDWGV